MAPARRLTSQLHGARRHLRALRWDRYNYFLFVASAGFVSLVVMVIILFLAIQGFGLFRSISPLEFFFSTHWAPPEKLGALPFIVGSFEATLIALVLGVPLGLSVAIFLAKIASPTLREILRPAMDLLVGIPSVVYGTVGMLVLVPIIRERVGGAGYGLLAAGIVLAIMVLPTVIGVAEDALRSLPHELEEISLGLGATRWQTIWHVLLPAARPGLTAAVVLALARAIGETTAVQMVIGNSPLLVTSLLQPASTLTSEILLEMGNAPIGTPWNDALFMMAFMLLMISLALTLLVRWLGRGKHAGRT